MRCSLSHSTDLHISWCCWRRLAASPRPTLLQEDGCSMFFFPGCCCPSACRLGTDRDPFLLAIGRHPSAPQHPACKLHITSCPSEPLPIYPTKAAGAGTGTLLNQPGRRPHRQQSCRCRCWPAPTCSSSGRPKEEKKKKEKSRSAGHAALVAVGCRKRSLSPAGITHASRNPGRDHDSAHSRLAIGCGQMARAGREPYQLPAPIVSRPPPACP